MLADVSGHAFELPLRFLKLRIGCQLLGGSGLFDASSSVGPDSQLYTSLATWQNSAQSGDAVSGTATHFFGGNIRGCSFVCT
ncbi:MAG: hypothetical protein DMG44_11375 [Acidobacteria bacterium]|jgi:hypothetical protein|nr:MAG: hypothetical protein DMG44_11375 [Acidobacteriota bacterium]